MSHFSVLVISPTELTTETLGAILQPWHAVRGAVDVAVRDAVEDAVRHAVFGTLNHDHLR